MLVTTLVMVLCSAVIAFYVRFLVALRNEFRPRSSGYWVRLRLASDEDTVAEPQEQQEPATRAA